MLELKTPSIALLPLYGEFLEDMRAHDQKLWDPYVPAQGQSPEDFIGALLLRAHAPGEGLVPETVYWAVFEGTVVGRISLRHRLEGNLHKLGGHIGYEVRPNFRRRGLATEMLRQILDTPKAREIGRLLLTCAPANIASNKTILANGGKLTQTIYVDVVQASRNHYWIELG